MKYNFDEIIPRRGTNSYKWDSAEDADVLPMWVADMDFRTAPPVVEALKKRVEHGIFGYVRVPDAYYEAVVNWFARRHAWRMEKEWIIYTTGVVPAISAVIKALTLPGDKVMVQTPVYNCFFSSIRNNGCEMIANPLVYRNRGYQIDFDDLEEKLANPQTSLLLLCNPHNPVGKIWDSEELKRIGELCWKHHVLVLSDEIHCDITEPGKDYSPFASVSETCKNNSITCVAATKAFNIAGIQTAAVIVPDKTIRHRVSRGLNTDEVAEPNVFALTAPIAAFTKGGAWLDELRAYLWENRKTAEAFIKEEIPQISVVAAEATYLLWIDCTRIAKKEDNLCAFIRSHSGLYLCDGAEYRNGDGFLRMNLACPKTQVEDGLRRLKESVEAYQKRYAG